MIARAAAGLFSAIVRLRAHLYHRGALSRHRLPLPTISIGNLTLGGTGKTPLAACFARLLEEEGCRPALISRGYKGEGERNGLLVNDGTGVRCRPRECGDEPYLLAQQLPKAPLAVGRDRLRAFELIRPLLGPRSVCILDDAYQHLRLERDLDVLTLDASSPFGGGRTLPAGRLREPLSAMKRADWIVITRCREGRDTSSIEQLARRFNDDAALLRFGHRATALVEVGGCQAALDCDWASKPAVAMAGIGNPGQFGDDLARLGFKIEKEVWFPDHHWYRQEDLDQVLSRIRPHGPEIVLTTEKDAVRLLDLDVPKGKIFALRIEARALDGERFLSEMRRWLREVFE